MIIRLQNGAQAMMWNVTPGGRGFRNYVGTVLARWDHGIHPWVVWSMASDDGQRWDCEQGDYCMTVEEASEIFATRAGTRTASFTRWLGRREEMEETYG